MKINTVYFKLFKFLQFLRPSKHHHKGKEEAWWPGPGGVEKRKRGKEGKNKNQNKNIYR